MCRWCTGSCGVTPHDDLVKAPMRRRLHFPHVQAVMRGGIHCGSMWLRDSEGLSPENLALLDEASLAISQLRGLWIVAGDWNISPDTLRQSQ